MLKVIGLWSDGASTMRGVYRGVFTKLARHICALQDAALTDIAAGDMTRTRDTFHSLRGVFSIHCVCHRLALIVTDSFKGTQVIEKVVPDECLELLSKLRVQLFWKKY